MSVWSVYRAMDCDAEISRWFDTKESQIFYIRWKSSVHFMCFRRLNYVQDILYTLKIYVERCDIRTDIQRSMDDQNVYPIVIYG
jgi:hypothetical protein